MKKLNFKIKLVAIISCFISLILVIGVCFYIFTQNIKVFILSIIVYIFGKFINSLIWRCPYCNNKLPYGIYTYNVNMCKKCGNNLSE